MAEPDRKRSGCGMMVIYTAVFRKRRSPRTRRCSSTGSLPAAHNIPGPQPVKRRLGSDDSTIGLRPVNPLVHPATPAPTQKVSALNPQRPARVQPGPVKASPGLKPVPVPRIGLSGELESVLYDYQRAQGSNKLVRATSGNVMLYGNLGNIRSNGSSDKDSNISNGTGPKRATGHVVKTQREMNVGNTVMSRAGDNMGNLIESQAGLANVVKSQTGTDPKSVLCRALSRRLEPEELKEMGNEQFSQGRFAEALAYYDRAIAMDPGKASYRSNKAAALTGLGRILEAAGECKEAVRIDPTYCRAHNRLGSLYFRLGEPGKAIHHYKLAKTEADPSDFARVQTLQRHLAKCSDSRRTRDWLAMLKESRSANSIGADSSPQVFAWQVEALIKLHKHDEADKVSCDAPKFDIDALTKIFGGVVNGYILMIQAQVDMASGRFDEAVRTAQKATQLDISNREICTMARRTQAVASARSKGNNLFKASKFSEACLAYGEGLDHDPNNAILLSNRAASRSKLCQWEKAIEDCTSALKLRPSYAKARLRRAYCNTKLERWAASVQDYEMLIEEIPGDEEVIKGLLEAKSKMQNKRGDLVVKDTVPS